MSQSEGKTLDELTLCFALRHLGEVRELLIVKNKKTYEFYVFPPFKKNHEKPRIDLHTSQHESGVFHTILKVNGQEPKSLVRYVPSRTNQPPIEILYQRPEMTRRRPADLKGAMEIFSSFLACSQFQDLPPLGTNKGDVFVLDAESAGFTDDAVFVRVYLVAPGAEDCIPVFPYVSNGARILKLEKGTTPWIAVEVFQQAEPVGRDMEILRNWERQVKSCSG
jgi:hypothetical protein